MVQAADQHVARALRGLFAIDMRRGTKGREHVQAINNSAAQTSMQVKARGHQTILAHNPASRLDPIAVGVLHALDEHCAVPRQINTVQRKQVSDPLQEFRFKRIVSFSLDWSRSEEHTSELQSR